MDLAETVSVKADLAQRRGLFWLVCDDDDELYGGGGR